MTMQRNGRSCALGSGFRKIAESNFPLHFKTAQSILRALH